MTKKHKPCDSTLLVKSTASLSEAVAKELNQPDPEEEKALAIVKGEKNADNARDYGNSR